MCAGSFGTLRFACFAPRARKRKRQAASDELLPQQELARRRRQREQRELALKLRAEGKEYKKGKKKHKPRRKVQVIVIPIVWQKKKGETAQTMEAAEAAVQVLREAGIKADIDSTTEKTPGQKMRAWEEKGVKLRVEVGPKEAAAGQVVFAVSTTPGEVAAKQTVAAGKALCQLARQQLEAMGQTVGPPMAAGIKAAAGGKASADAEEEEEEGGQRAGAHGANKRREGEEEGEQQRQQQEQRQQQQQRHRSAEEVEGDFAGLLPDNGSQGGKGKGKKKAAAAATAAAEVDEFRELLAEGQEGGQKKEKKKKGSKVVVF